jgi:hypothetical protein
MLGERKKFSTPWFDVPDVPSIVPRKPFVCALACTRLALF